MEEVFEDKFNFVRNSYLTIGSISKNCLKFLPPSKTNTPQNIFIGDARGILYVCDFKKKENEIDIVIKTNPFSKEITCIDLNYNVKQEKIYFSFGNSIFLTNRQCKEYSKIEFDIADNISMFRVIDNQIWLATNTYLNQYEYGQFTSEKFSSENEAVITALAISEVLGKMSPLSLIGTVDNKIKVLNADKLFFQLKLNSIPSVIQQYRSSVNDLNENHFLFGTQLGSHGLMNLDKKELKILYEKNTDKNRSEVVAMKTFDINLDGNNEVMLLRANGELDIYNVGSSPVDTFHVSKYCSNKILTGFEIGKFRSGEETDILVSSYSGLVFSLTPSYKLEENQKKTLDKGQLSKKIKELKSEVEQLKGILANKKEEYQKQINNNSQPITKNPYKVNYKFSLFPSEAAYLLIFESEFPIEIIVLESQNRVDVLDVLTRDVNVNYIENKGNKMMATFKMKESSHQLEVKIRTYEGSSDYLICTIIPYNKPKTANILEIPIKSLALHKKIDQLEETGDSNEKAELDSIMNVLNVKGDFNASKINQLLHLIIPDIPEKILKEEASYTLQSTFLNTTIDIKIENNKCQLKSLFFSPLIIAKEQITKEASLSKIELEFNIQMKTNSVFKILEKVNPMIQEIYALESKFKILQAFQELDKKIVKDELPEEYQIIYENKDEINKKYEKRFVNLNYLKIIIENLLKDVSKVRTIPNIQGKIKEIEDLFNDYTYEKLTDIFRDLKI